MTQSDAFVTRYMDGDTTRRPGAAGLTVALDAAGIESETQWDTGRITWTFEDGSSITIDDTHGDGDDDYGNEPTSHSRPAVLGRGLHVRPHAQLR